MHIISGRVVSQIMGQAHAAQHSIQVFIEAVEAEIIMSVCGVKSIY